MMKGKKKGVRFAGAAALIPETGLTESSFFWLAAGLFMAAAWHIPHTPVWALLALSAVLFRRHRLLVKKMPPPSRRLILILTLAGVAGVILHYKSFLGRDPGITALLILTTLKILEIKNQRDYMMAAYLCYFLVFGNFLYEQTMPTLMYMMVAVVVITAAVLRQNMGGGSVKTGFLLKRAFFYFLLSVPFMVVLFLLFPRSSFPMWNLGGRNPGRGVSGFTDYLHPGSLSELAQSDKPAFRVRFPDGNMPTQRDLYFRGVVLWMTKGESWYEGIQRRDVFLVGRAPSPKDIRQEFMLEPHYRQWLFTLDNPVRHPRWARLFLGNVLQSLFLVTTTLRYEVIASPERGASLAPRLEEQLRRMGLQLPEGWTSPIRDLGRSWRKTGVTDAEIAQKGLDYFRDNDFKYTLKPGELDELQPLEDFLFRARQGYCEHFAAAYALLMRAAGVPARVVSGYQGGVYNEVGDYLLVRQMDAHAWTEIWLEGAGWRRVDPTAVAAPERVEFGVDVSRSLEEEGGADGDRTSAVQRAMRSTFLKKMWRWLEQHWDNINNKWELWILSYNRFTQRDILREMGLVWVDRWGLLALAAGLTAGVFFLILFMVRRRGVKRDPVLDIYLKFCMKTARKGIYPAPWEGPLDFRLRLADAFPHKMAEIHGIIDAYVSLRYGREAVTRERLKQFSRLAAGFKIQ